MTSEIRANTLKNRVGLGTISFTNTGPVVSGIVTANGLELNSVDAGSTAGPELKLFRNSASPADADYLGQLKFAGESDTGVERNYAKITGKILDASNGTEDGILEFAHIKAGSQTITGRWRSDSLQLLNSTNLTVDGDIDVDGHTNLDNVSIAGVTTHTGNAVFSGLTASGTIVGVNATFSGNINNSPAGNGSISGFGAVTIQANTPALNFTESDANPDYRIIVADGVFKVQDVTNSYANRLTIGTTGNISISKDLDVDGHTNLDNVSIAGVVTATSFVGSGANLTGLVSVANQANNRLITATGTTDALNAETALTFYQAGNDAILTIEGTNSAGHAQLTLKTGGTTDHCSINFGDSADHDAGEIRYTNSSDSLNFDTAGTPRMVIDSDGDLGIGDLDPNIRLTVVDSGTENLVRIGRSDANGHASHTVNVKASKDFYHNFKMEASSYNLDCYNGSAMIDAFKVHNTGYAELAGAADIRLTLGNYGTAGSNGANWVRGTNSSLYYNAGAGIHLWEIGGTEHMRLNGSGNLYLRSESANYVVLGNSGDNTSSNVTNSMNWIRGNQTHLQYNSNGGMHSWEISGAEKLRIDSDGTLKLTTPGNTQQQTFFTTFTINNTNSSTYSRIRFDRSNVSRWGISLDTGDRFAITNLYKNGSVAANDNTFIIKNDDKIGLNYNNPQAQLHIRHGNSNTDSGLMIQSSVGRYHQTFCGQVTFPSSNGWVNFIYSDHSHSIEIQYMILEDENAGYGGAHGRLSFFTTYGNSSGPVYHENRRNAMNGGGITSDPEFYYQNTGGTVSHMIKVRLSYNTSRTFRMHYMVRGFATGRMYQL